MRLKKIRLAGFKSFVDPTNIPFVGDMTAIVGPNGCGKSNVIDAVRWVLGESSAKNLRGDAMTDVIFNGSNTRKAVSQCSVELVFDNSSGRIAGEYAAFNEISVKRLVTKDAVSSYFLNGSKCRRKDVTDLFLGTGLGPRSYAIIEQGMISKLIESKPQELRVFIEEAAGISKYKERRRETQNRINHTRENLSRLDDVRQSMAEQLTKLKRQAQAATRYTELKKEERRLKLELATIRWLEQTRLIERSQQIIDAKQLALDDLKASQNNEQSGLQAFKNEYSIVKQSADDTQKQIYTLGTEITRLEQSQLFAKKRSAQIQAEIDQIKQTEYSLNIDIEAIKSELAITEQQALELDPEREILEEQLFEIEHKKAEKDASYHEVNSQLKASEKSYFEKNQQLQQKHGQIQQTLSLQARTESRLAELNHQLKNVDCNELTQELSELNLQIHELENTLDAQQRDLESQKHRCEIKKCEYTQAETQLLASEKQLTQIEANLNALNNLQKEFSTQPVNMAIESEIDCEPLHSYFSVKQEHTKIVYAVLKHIEPCVVVKQSNQLDTDRKRMLSEKFKQNVLFESAFSSDKAPNSVAQLLPNSKVPNLFNQYLMVGLLQEAYAGQDSLTAYQFFVTPEGDLVGKDSFIAYTEKDNKFAREAQITSLKIQQTEQQQKYAQSKSNTSALKQAYDEAEAHIEQYTNDISNVRLELQQKTIRQQNLEFKLDQFEQRLSDIKSEIEEQQINLEQERMSLEQFNEEVEELSIDVIEVEQVKTDLEQKSVGLNQEVQLFQAKQNDLQQKIHQLALQIQHTRNSLKVLQEQLKSKQRITTDNQEKLQLLFEEAEDLNIPEAQQHDKLQLMLEQQEQLRATLTSKQSQLHEIEKEINLLEQGQQGVQIKMDKIKAEIDSERIAQEGANVRAQAFIEQVAQLEQPIKVILESLPEDADDPTWQDQLDKTSAAIQKLGAVNLAAVQEFEEQSQRKEHLDAQNQDLTDALTTLENAMRKIDRETRTRFKATFDQINADLKSLFPKVFGGGMAYLDLTDDDMLDTGVTIMARPPGKKNSTIQLLSGGEKALTALSLVFAIFRLNPAPFCLLDEVDAPLDDANVNRFCRLVSQMSETVQFIYITHNKVAMEMATHLTGVTMAEPGVSRMVAVDIQEALEIAE